MEDLTPLSRAVAERGREIRERIAAAGGDPERVHIVAVTKGMDVSAVVAACAAGFGDVAENYAQDLLAKVDALAARDDVAPRWNFVGRLQRNKVPSLAASVSVWQSVDRARLAEAIASRSPGACVFVQVNVTGEPQKGGCPPTDAPALVDACRSLHLDVRGLMTVGPAGPPEGARPGFRSLAALANQLGVRELSMGMSGDFEVAVQEGATVLRIGRGLFGPRPVPPGLRR